ncbi:MAG: 3-isopropylmalate dehydratase [Acidobacteria bacterium]|nr:3-isopropylmalate dehydratase [Acidobacteriota bacterium]
MIDSLLKRRIERRRDPVRFEGRILYLTEDPALVKQQLDGEDLDWKPEVKLRDDISTDEITPAHICFHYDEKLGEFPYLGLKCGSAFPVTRDAVRRGGFVASVSGKRRGKGSSREQSPYAERCAGIRVVLAENLERIYKQNCQNLGLLTATDLDLIPRIRSGQEIPLSAFTEGEDPITAQIVAFGGLFNFNVARLQGRAAVPLITTPGRPMTLAEKILARHFVAHPAAERAGLPAVQPGDSGFVRTDLRFSHEYVTPMAAIFFEKLVGADEPVNDPASILFFRDHLTFLDDVMPPERRAMGLIDLARHLEEKQAEFARRQGIRLHGELADRKGSEGICHSLILERYALPGQLIIGSDSHTPHSGAIGAMAFGVGTTDIFNSWITRDVRIRVPETVRVLIHGQLRGGLTAKDLILALLRTAYVRSGQAIGKVIEYAGEVVESLDIDERATLTNMAAEVGGFTGIVAPDRKTSEFLVERRGMHRADAERLCEGWAGDPAAPVDQVIEINASELRPLVALPGDPGQGVFIDELDHPVGIEIAYGGSCTAGKKEDMDMYARVLEHALVHGRHVAPGVEFYIQFGSQDVREYCERKGYIDVFRRAGARLIEPSCGACINAGPGATVRNDQVAISAQNRNFPGRSGPGQLYLASPLTVAASAIEGRIVAFEGERD